MLATTTVTPFQDMAVALANLKSSKGVLQYVSRCQRQHVASDLANAITAALEHHTAATW